MKSSTMKSIKYTLCSVLFVLSFYSGTAQITVTNTQSVNTLVQTVLLGQGVNATNITVNGSPLQGNSVVGNLTYFDAANSGFSIPGGLLLTTGNGIGAIGPNSQSAATNNNPPTSNVSTDPHLTAIANATVTNGIVLEFDFIPAGDTVSFSYIFGSDEYPEFSPSTFNDAFGFFLWGPGISGPFALAGYPSGGENLAIIPGTSLPVTINNLGPGAGQYPQYYMDNIGGAAYGTAIEYDGTTTLLKAQSAVICSETYHVKLCISNVGDQAYDSGVFLQGSSFNSDPNYNCSNAYGLVYHDPNDNCIQETNEYGVVGVNLNINPGSYVATTVSGGFWSIDSLPVGSYSVTIDTTNLQWDITCPIVQYFDILTPFDVVQAPDFGMISNNPCAEPDVSIFAPSLSNCQANNVIYVSACNQITATAIIDSVFVEVELDSLLSIVSASIPYTSLGNNTYSFFIGDLIMNQCTDFTLTTFVDCNTLPGQTLCMSAEIVTLESCVLDSIPSLPSSGVSPCTLPWDQSSLSVNGWCANDTVYFSVTNTGSLGGGDMECYSPVYVYLDGLLVDFDSIMIQGGETVIYSFAGYGQTWQLAADQHPLHPGNSNPNAYVDLCGDTTNWTPNLVNNLPQNDADPVIDIYCGPVTQPYDPNDKRGYPSGVSGNHYIQSNQQMQYYVRFQNTGTDTAMTVIIRDTLDENLNIFTVVPGVASHPYEFKMYGQRVMEWTFPNIMLPDSVVDEPGSHGFMTYHVDQVPNLTPGTIFYNSAHIYFDFNAPITTNETFHEIGVDPYLSSLSVNEIGTLIGNISVYPNPTNQWLNVVADSDVMRKLELYDIRGSLLQSKEVNSMKHTLDFSELSNGVYLLTIHTDEGFTNMRIVKQ